MFEALLLTEFTVYPQSFSHCHYYRTSTKNRNHRFNGVGHFYSDTGTQKTNPLVKIPTLVLDSGESVIDSPVICEYLNSISLAGTIYPKDQNLYFLQKKFEALADGAMDAAVLRRKRS